MADRFGFGRWVIVLALLLEALVGGIAVGLVATLTIGRG